MKSPFDSSSDAPNKTGLAQASSVILILQHENGRTIQFQAIAQWKEFKRKMKFSINSTQRQRAKSGLLVLSRPAEVQ